MRNYQTLSPTTGDLLASYPEITTAEAISALTAAHARYTTDWRLRPIIERSKILSKAAHLMNEQAPHLASLLTLEMGKLRSEALSEVHLSASILEYYATHGPHFLQPVSVPEAPNSVIVTQSIGVLLAIEPWNFPYYQLARVAGPQLVAGNVLLVKHARNVPQCALAFARILTEAGAPEGTYTNLFCSFSALDILIDDFRVRGVTLTGSEGAGSKVAERAGKNLKKVVLELGGSDPFIVLEDADLDLAVSQGAIGRLQVMGQVCVSSKRFIVIGKARAEMFLEGLMRAFASLKVGDPANEDTTLGPLSSEKGMNDLLSQIEVAWRQGATIAMGGKRIDRPGFYVQPTIITNISPANPLFQQETFGPVAALYAVDGVEEAIKLANATRFGLGASVFGKDLTKARMVAGEVESGMVFINSAAYFAPELPFGGVKNSGFGRELGEMGIGGFVNRKLVRTAM